MNPSALESCFLTDGCDNKLEAVCCDNWTARDRDADDSNFNLAYYTFYLVFIDRKWTLL